jgi:hypothetical protein
VKNEPIAVQESDSFQSLASQHELRNIVELVKSQLSQEMAHKLTQIEFAKI